MASTAGFDYGLSDAAVMTPTAAVVATVCFEIISPGMHLGQPVLLLSHLDVFQEPGLGRIDVPETFQYGTLPDANDNERKLLLALRQLSIRKEQFT